MARGSAWVAARDLKVGEQIRSINGQGVKIKGIRRESLLQEVFNLEVSELSNYFVGAVGLLVHNVKVDQPVEFDSTGRFEIANRVEATNVVRDPLALQNRRR